MPEAELHLDAAVVTRLLGDQHPDLVDLPLTELSRGWDNTMFRLGTELTVRLPHRHLAADLLAAEQRWLPTLAPRLPLPIPVPVRVGTPTTYYPWGWSVLPWFEGLPLGTDPDIETARAAEDLGRFLAALHQPATDAPINAGRGVPLSVRHQMTIDRIDAIAVADSPFTAVECDELRRRWERYLTIPAGTGLPCGFTLTFTP